MLLDEAIPWLFLAVFTAGASGIPGGSDPMIACLLIAVGFVGTIYSVKDRPRLAPSRFVTVIILVGIVLVVVGLDYHDRHLGPLFTIGPLPFGVGPWKASVAGAFVASVLGCIGLVARRRATHAVPSAGLPIDAASGRVPRRSFSDWFTGTVRPHLVLEKADVWLIELSAVTDWQSQRTVTVSGELSRADRERRDVRERLTQFARLLIRNDPGSTAPTAVAKGVSARIRFLDADGTVRCTVPKGRWTRAGARSFPASRVDQSRVDFGIGETHSLDIAFKYNDKIVPYAIDDDSVNMSNWENPRYMLDGKRFDVVVELSGEWVRTELRGELLLVRPDEGHAGHIEFRARAGPTDSPNIAATASATPAPTSVHSSAPTAPPLRKDDLAPAIPEQHQQGNRPHNELVDQMLMGLGEVFNAVTSMTPGAAGWDTELLRIGRLGGELKLQFHTHEHEINDKELCALFNRAYVSLAMYGEAFLQWGERGMPLSAPGGELPGFAAQHWERFKEARAEIIERKRGARIYIEKPAAISEEAVALDTCRRLVQAASDACTDLLTSASHQAAEAVYARTMDLQRFIDNQACLLSNAVSAQVKEGLTHLAWVIKETTEGVDAASTAWRKHAHGFLSATSGLRGSEAPSAIAPPLSMQVLYTRMQLQGLGPNRLLAVNALVQFHNTGPNPLTAYGISASIVDGDTLIIPVPDPLENNPESINFLRTRVDSYPAGKAIDMTHGIRVDAGAVSDLYAWHMPARVPLSAYPDDAKLRLTLSAMKQPDSREDIAFPWHLLLEKIILTLRELKR